MVQQFQILISPTLPLPSLFKNPCCVPVLECLSLVMSVSAREERARTVNETTLIGLHRRQNYKVVARTVNETTIDPVTRKQKRKGNSIKHKLGDIVTVDWNVKGSDNGTPSDPKFALRTLW